MNKKSTGLVSVNEGEGFGNPTHIMLSVDDDSNVNFPFTIIKQATV